MKPAFPAVVYLIPICWTIDADPIRIPHIKEWSKRDLIYALSFPLRSVHGPMHRMYHCKVPFLLTFHPLPVHDGQGDRPPAVPGEPAGPLTADAAEGFLTVYFLILLW